MGRSLLTSCLLLLYLTFFVSCYPYLEFAVYSPPSSFATSVKEKGAQKPFLRQILGLKTDDHAFVADQKYGEAQESLRSWRNSWLISFLTDLSTNIMDYVPRAAIYVLVVSCALISFLFCITILVKDRSH